MIEEQLLPELQQGQVDLLPSNSHIFRSTVRHGRWFWISVWLGSFITAILLLAGIGVKEAREGAFYGVVGGLVAVALIVCGVWVLHRRRVHEQQKSRDEWHEGIIVFPSGDMVIFFKDIFRTINTTVEILHLTRVDVTIEFSLFRCKKKHFLRIYYHDIEGRQRLIKIREDNFEDDVKSIAQYINDRKQRAIE